jgi:hypothetical protein
MKSERHIIFSGFWKPNIIEIILQWCSSQPFFESLLCVSALWSMFKCEVHNTEFGIVLSEDPGLDFESSVFSSKGSASPMRMTLTMLLPLRIMEFPPLFGGTHLKYPQYPWFHLIFTM